MNDPLSLWELALIDQVNGKKREGELRFTAIRLSRFEKGRPRAKIVGQGTLVEKGSEKACPGLFVPDFVPWALGFHIIRLAMRCISAAGSGAGFPRGGQCKGGTFVYHSGAWADSALYLVTLLPHCLVSLLQ
jgi:hypothetical protein